MIGAICGDIIGSVYEFSGEKNYEFPLFSGNSEFTDDTVLTIAIADALISGEAYEEFLYKYAICYPGRGYGGMFSGWVKNPFRKPYNSFGNGSAMRVSPIGWWFHDLDTVLMEAKRSSEVTHNHPEGIKGAQAVASAIFLARNGETKQSIKKYITNNFGYDLTRKVDDIKQGYEYDVTCQGSVPESIIAFLESSDYEDAVRKAVSMGGDVDTMACIAGSIAEAYYKKIPENIVFESRKRLDSRLLIVLDLFDRKLKKRLDGSE